MKLKKVLASLIAGAIAASSLIIAASATNWSGSFPKWTYEVGGSTRNTGVLLTGTIAIDPGAQIQAMYFPGVYLGNSSLPLNVATTLESGSTTVSGTVADFTLDGQSTDVSGGWSGSGTLQRPSGSTPPTVGVTDNPGLTSAASGTTGAYFNGTLTGGAKNTFTRNRTSYTFTLRLTMNEQQLNAIKGLITSTSGSDGTVFSVFRGTSMDCWLYDATGTPPAGWSAGAVSWTKADFTTVTTGTGTFEVIGLGDRGHITTDQLSAADINKIVTEVGKGKVAKFTVTYASERPAYSVTMLKLNHVIGTDSWVAPNVDDLISGKKYTTSSFILDDSMFLTGSQSWNIFELSVVDGTGGTISLKKVELEIVDAGAAAVGILIGDVDGNGSIEVADAREVLRHSVRKASVIDSNAGARARALTPEGNGLNPTVKDALWILKVIVGKA